MNLPLETYDVVDTIATSTKFNPNFIFIKSNFVNNSKVRGVLYAFICIEHNSINFLKSSYVPVSRELALRGMELKKNKGTYYILSYDIEENFMIQSNEPSDVDMITIVDGANNGKF